MLSLEPKLSIRQRKKNSKNNLSPIGDKFISPNIEVEKTKSSNFRIDLSSKSGNKSKNKNNNNKSKNKKLEKNKIINSSFINLAIINYNQGFMGKSQWKLFCDIKLILQRIKDCE